MKYFFYDLYDSISIYFSKDVDPLCITPSDFDDDKVTAIKKGNKDKRNSVFHGSIDLKPQSAWSLSLSQESQRRLACVAGVVLVVAGFAIAALSVAATFFSGGGSLFGLFIADALFGVGLALMGGVAISYSRNGVLPSFNLCKCKTSNTDVDSTNDINSVAAKGFEK